MKRFALAVAAVGVTALTAVTGCQQNGGAHAEVSTDRPVATSSTYTTTETTAAARSATTPYVATRETRYVYSPVDTTTGGTLRAGDVIYVEGNTATGTGFFSTAEGSGWKMARTAEGRTIFVHPADFRPR